MPPPQALRYGFRKLNVDLSLVPPSRHSVFVRGLPRNAPADNIRDIFADECGRCCILFHKTRPTGIFMVLRFDKTDDAKRAIERFDGWKYKGQYRLSVNWYKDVLKYHLDQKQKQSADKLYGHRAVSRAKQRWWQPKPTNNKFGRTMHRSYDRSFDRSLNRSFDRPYNRSWEKSHNMSDRGSRERSRERSRDRSHDRSGESSDGRSRENSHERSRERSCERSRESSSESSQIRSRERSLETGERHYEKCVESTKMAHDRFIGSSSYSRSRSPSPEPSSTKKPSEKRLSRYSPESERYAKRQKHDTIPQRFTSAEGKVEDAISEKMATECTETPESVQPETSSKPLKCLEPGEIESGSSDESPRNPNWETPQEPTASSPPPAAVSTGLARRRPVGLRPLTIGHPKSPRAPVGLRLSSVRPSQSPSPSKPQLSPRQLPDKISGYDSYKGGWIEVGKITRKGPRSQYRKFMMGKGKPKDVPLEKDVAEEEKPGSETIVIECSDDKNGTEECEKKDPDSDLKMKRLEEACLASLHTKSREKFTREIFGPRGSAADFNTVKPPKPSSQEKKQLSCLEQIRAEEMSQFSSESGGLEYELKSPLLKTPKKDSSLMIPEEDTPTKDEHEGVEDVGSDAASTGTKPFFLRFTPHRLSYQSPLAIFSSLEESQPTSQAVCKKKIYHPDEENDFAASLVSKLTGTKKYSERKDTTVPSDDRVDLDFIDSELEKSYEEKCSDFHAHKSKTGRCEPQKSKFPSLVPYSVGDNSVSESASFDLCHPGKDISRDEADEDSFASLDRTGSKSFIRSRHRKLSSDSSSKRHDTSNTTTTSSSTNTTMETSDSSFSSPSKPVRHGHGRNRHGHVSKRKRSISPNSSIWSTVSRSLSRSPDSRRSQSPIRSRSPDNRTSKRMVLGRRSRSRSESPNSSLSPSRSRKDSQRRSKSVSPSRSSSPGNRSWSPTGRCRKKVSSPTRSRSTSPSVSPSCRSRRKLRSLTPTSSGNRSHSPGTVCPSPSSVTRRRSLRSPNRPRSRSPSPGYSSSSPRKTPKSGSYRSRHQDEDLLSPSGPLSIHCKEMITSTPTKADQKLGVQKKKALSRGQMQRVLQKKRELEMAFKSDCETICSVTKVLLSKDQSLEEQLCNSAKKTLTDLGSRFVSQLQEFIDSLSTNIPHPQQSILATRKTTLT